MRNTFRKILVTLLSVSLGFAGVVATESSSQALNANTFDPGLIISDSVFFDWGAMNADSIQKFLNARVSTCTDNDGGPKCIRNYREDVVGSVAIKSSLHSYSKHICADIPAASNQTAASIIASVAVACRINPRVLLVTLQKEQGLISSADPTAYMYKAAMGYGCPDSAPQICGQDSNAKSRLFWQLYRAAWQLRWYGDPRGSFTYLKPGKTIKMGYNPNAACGKKSFKLKSQATANLYYYTPYTPNTAALNNLWGTGDSCSAYGNRNFWRQFWTWFGSPVAGGYLLKASSNVTYLVNQSTNKRYQVTNDALIGDFQPLGPLGTVSDEYMASFTDAGPLKSLVADDSGARFLISSGLKYKVENSTQAAALGLDWAGAPVLTDVQISNFADMVMAKSPNSPEVFLLQGSTRALVSNQEAINALSEMGAIGVVQDSVLQGFNIVAPVSELVQDSSGNRFALADVSKIPIASQALATSLGYNWSTATTISTAQLAKVDTAAFIKTASSASTYLLSGETKHLVPSAVLTALAKFGKVAQVSDTYLARFSTGQVVSSLLKVASDNWYITGGNRFLLSNQQATDLNLDLARSVTVSAAQLATIPAPILMKPTATGPAFLVDDYLNKYPIDAADLPKYSGLGSVGVVPQEYLDRFVTKTNPGGFVNSTDTFHYYLSGGKKFRVTSAATAKAISPASFGPTATFDGLPTLTATQLAGYGSLSTSAITTNVKGTSGSYLIQNGTLREYLDVASFNLLVGNLPPESPATATYFPDLPIGVPILAENSLFKNSTNGTYGVFLGNTYFPIAPNFYPEVKDASSWHFTKSSGTLSSNSISKLSQGSLLTPFVVAENAGYLLSASGKQPVSDILNVVANPSRVSNDLLAKIDTSSAGALATPILMKSTQAKSSTYVVAAGLKRAVLDKTEVNLFLPISSSRVVQTWSPAAVAAISAGKSALAPRSLVKIKGSKVLYMIDGLNRALKVSSTIAAALGDASAKTVSKASLAGYNRNSSLTTRKITCLNKTWISDSGTLMELDANAISQWPGSSAPLDTLTCQSIRNAGVRLGLFIEAAGKRYKVVAGKLRPIRTSDEYAALSSGQTPSVVVSATLVKAIAKGNPTSYVVAKGDTLKKIASKFKTTVAKIKALNSLAKDALTRGQVLNLP